MQELQYIQELYTQTYDRSLLDDVIADTSGDFKDLLKQLLRCERPQGEIVDRKLAESDARRLYKVAATPRFIIFIMICLVLLLALKIHNFNQLQLMHIFACYILLSTLCYHTLVHQAFGS